jgi:hypothetical protein
MIAKQLKYWNSVPEKKDVFWYDGGWIFWNDFEIWVTRDNLFRKSGNVYQLVVGTDFYLLTNVPEELDLYEFA